MQKKYPIGGYAPGNYWNKCGTCNVEFTGDKRAYQCEPCGTKSQAKYDTLTDEEKEEQIKRNVEVYNQFIKIVRDPTINKPHPAVAHRFPEPTLTDDDVKISILKKHYREYYKDSFPAEKVNDVVDQALSIKEETEVILKAMDEYKQAQTGAVWVKALTNLPPKPGEYHSKKHGKRFVMLFAEADRKMPKEYWEGVEWLDESLAAPNLDELYSE